MPSSSTTTLLMAGSVVLAAAAATQFFPRKSSSRGATDISEEEENADTIGADLVCKVFDRLFLEMQAVVVQLSQQVQQIQMSGQQIPEAQLRKLLTAEFERALTARQAQVYEDHDVDADCIEEATWEFVAKEDPKVVNAVERFQKLYESISGGTLVGRRPGVKVETKVAKIIDSAKTIEAASVYFVALSNVMREIVEQFKADGRNLQDPAVANDFQRQFASVANEVGEKALEAIGLTLNDFQASVEKNSGDPQVARSLQMLQMQQQKDLMEMGMVPPGM